MQRGDFRPKMKKAPRRIRAGRISIAQERERERVLYNYRLYLKHMK
jgi:hypothetical protein